MNPAAPTQPPAPIMPQVQPQISVSPPQKKFPHLLLIIIEIVLFLLTVSTGSFFYFTLNKKSAELSKMSAGNSAAAPTPITVPTTTATQDFSQPTEASSSSEWIDYSNTKYGFSLKYPPGFVTIDSVLAISKLYPKPPSNISLQSANMSMDISIAAAPAGLSIHNALGEGPGLLYDFSLLTKKNDNSKIIKIDGIDAIRADGVNIPSRSPVTDVIFFKDKMIYEISFFPITEDNSKTFDEILSGFKFTPQIKR